MYERKRKEGVRRNVDEYSGKNRKEGGSQNMVMYYQEAVLLYCFSTALVLIISKPGVQNNNFLQERDILLCDGTRVHLMENSELIYPDEFSEDIREVRLIGEGYFEVKSSPERPFIVKMQDGEIRVLGTKFLASAYPDKEIKVSLDEGVIELTLEGQEPIIMKAAQEVSYDAKEEKAVENYIVFKDARLEDIMISMGRIYGVNTVFGDEDIKDIRLSCRIPRYDSITQFMDLVDIVCRLDVTLQNDTVIVKEK